ncbi:hypothetical protein KIN20_028416 [Parelaphostrongylus tenuis]|uniref:Uncharacterized protein n=1 Tax=Parelaphostrongylus tenuis TaxID=148309 RepID=A0AAD5WEN7_PARTN|nr:hypothetical protein KIN20_028416 [Parelaphostrongylus tenuis]KAJ1367491.1 hypothetical protein KIN20_028416 [Parelaphostrongylus tenuis]
MSTDQLSSLVESIESSIPMGTEAIKYNVANNHRPSSSRKLFENTSRNASEECPVADELLAAGEDWDECNNLLGMDLKSTPAISSEKISACLDKMFSKLSQDMGRVCAIYGDGSLLSQSSLTFEAELNELNKLCEADARDQLERYALRCHINEREKEQLHRRNRELHNAVEILRTQVVRSQVNIVDKVRMLSKQTVDALRALEQTSTAEITKWKQKLALLTAQSNTLQNQLKQTTMQLEAKNEELKEVNKHFDMLRFERDTLRNHNDHLEQQLEQTKSRVRDLMDELKTKEEALQANQDKVCDRDSQIAELTEKLKTVECVAEAHVKRKEDEITKQMNHYLQETRSIDAERERIAKIKVMEMQRLLKLFEDQKEAAERRAQIAEEKVADYENNFIHYRGQMEGEAIRAITNGYRNALSNIPSSARENGLSINRLFPLRPLSNCENIEPPADPYGKPSSNRRSRLPSRSESLSDRREPYPERRQK